MSKLISITSAVAVILLTVILLSHIRIASAPFPDSSGRHDSSVLSAEPHLHIKLTLAEKLWKQSVEDRSKMVTESGLGREFPDGYIYPYNVWDFARPSFFCPHDLERVGKLGDGGKVVCGMSRYERESPGPSSDTNTAPPLIVYSFGVNDDSSFEAALLERTNAEIWGYDYTVDSWAADIPDHQSSRAHFKRVGIGKETNESRTPPFFTIQDLMAANGHSYIDLVKMDIEGAEFDAMTSLISAVASQQGDHGRPTLPFGQLLIEIHFMKEGPDFSIPKDLEAWMKWWSAMEEMGLRPVNNEDNWVGDTVYGKPRFMEYTLIQAMDEERNKLLWA
ncbi:hypothetical protein DL764_011053 [Monosporascus ibericus]|uniref:Methyltransferase domain-containing protein n=1 Tax=Monosporascus ibericus TaxID=155417 RepID=A0A4Q4SRK5_9PEZI|nr:hypothetical protein DL764_011053 [Monosporascus ibericus]